MFNVRSIENRARWRRSKQ